MLVTEFSWNKRKCPFYLQMWFFLHFRKIISIPWTSFLSIHSCFWHTDHPSVWLLSVSKLNHMKLPFLTVFKLANTAFSRVQRNILSRCCSCVRSHCVSIWARPGAFSLSGQGFPVAPGMGIPSLMMNYWLPSVSTSLRLSFCSVVFFHPSILCDFLLYF